MLGLDEREGSQGERMRKAITAHGVPVAPLYGTRKDKKSRSWAGKNWA